MRNWADRSCKPWDIFKGKITWSSFVRIYLFSSGIDLREGPVFWLPWAPLCLLRDFFLPYYSSPSWYLQIFSLNWISLKYTVLSFFFSPLNLEMIFKGLYSLLLLVSSLHGQLPDECSTLVLSFPFNQSPWYFFDIGVTCQLSCLYESHKGIKGSWHWKQLAGCKYVSPWSPCSWQFCCVSQPATPPSWPSLCLDFCDMTKGSLGPFTFVNKTSQSCLTTQRVFFCVLLVGVVQFSGFHNVSFL